MKILVILIPVSLGPGEVGLAAFLWTLRHHQYEDPARDAVRILSDTYDLAPKSAHVPIPDPMSFPARSDRPC